MDNNRKHRWHLAIPILLTLTACDYSASLETPGRSYEVSGGTPHVGSSDLPVDAQSVPQPASIPSSDRIADQAHIISDTTEANLQQRLTDLETRTGHQLFIATVPSLDGKTVEDYSMTLANDWAIGRKDYDDGVLLLVAPTEKRTRIAIGYGLECAIPNEHAQQIIDETMIPHFKGGDFSKGIEAGTTQLITLLDTAPHDTRAIAQAMRERTGDNPDPCKTAYK